MSTRALRSCVAAIIQSATLISGPPAAGSIEETTTPTKVEELLTLLSDPGVQEWLQEQIKEAFDPNGIKFTFPIVRTAGESEPTNAADAHRAVKLAQPTAT